MNSMLSIGEVMIELSDRGGGMMRKGFAGDTFNTAFYARAFLPASWSVDYFTALGDDPASAELLDFIDSCGIGTGRIRTISGCHAGLYMIHLNEGERSFSYWRDSSAARRLADDEARLRRAIEEANFIYFSGITLAILPPAGREVLLEATGRAKSAGKIVAFDPNIRPRLWEDEPTMLATISAGAEAATMVLPGFDDEQRWFGDETPVRTMDRYHALGVSDVIVKDGERGVSLSVGADRFHVEACPAGSVVDTTSAGDSFNGAYLARLTCGDSPPEAATFAARVASKVIGHQGALIGIELLA